MSPLEKLRAFARYKTHAGYSWAAIMADGELVCESCVRENYRAVFTSTKRPGAARTDEQWQCIGLTNSGEAETDEHCAHCHKLLWSIDP